MVYLLNDSLNKNANVLLISFIHIQVVSGHTLLLKSTFLLSTNGNGVILACAVMALNS